MTRTSPKQFRPVVLFVFLAACFLAGHRTAQSAELKTWDGLHSISNIDVTVAYFVPRDRQALPDWKDRVRYFAKRIEQFHAREFQGQSTLKATVLEEPFKSARTTEQLRAGDANFIFFQTLREVDQELQFGRDKNGAFPILLVLSEINWRPLDDFFRVSPQNGLLKFEGQIIEGRHFPGAKSGGARATYLADRGVGWGLVSADGWRVPYCGTDCVIYHEGVGHPIGLPHPEPQNSSVMSLAQYRGWLSESSVDESQKKRLGWKHPDNDFDRTSDLFSSFAAVPSPLTPEPDEPVNLKLTWPKNAKVAVVKVQIQTELLGPWIKVTSPNTAVVSDAIVQEIALGMFDRPTPVSYRVDATLKNGETVELWGYFQVREPGDKSLLPQIKAVELSTEEQGDTALPTESIDLLPMIDVGKDAVAGKWIKADGFVESPKQFGARIEIPFEPPAEYELTVIATPLDEPNGLVLGQLLDGHRFLTLVNYAASKNNPASALENIDGRNVGSNATTMLLELLQKNRPSQIIVTVRKDSVVVQCDGRKIIDWRGKPEQLSLGDYWNTPNANSLFLGAYDCRYRFSRVSLVALSGTGKPLRVSPATAD
ncbi:MAG: hypothetical protein HQ518_08500 [Rhodopirellula sp.]|nr:hypothetical protein [Rhodopirellula sp.]